MSSAEILEKLPKLTLEERAEIFRHEALDTDAEIELSKEALAAFDEGIRSIETKPSFTAGGSAWDAGSTAYRFQVSSQVWRDLRDDVVYIEKENPPSS
jgi:hypothetical protein